MLYCVFLGGMYALVGAHLAQLVLNWENDSFAMRQRINICGMGNYANEQKPPAVLPASRIIRWFRLLLALVVLCLTLKPLPQNCAFLGLDPISHRAHLFGALSGVLSGWIFLKARKCTKQMHNIRNMLKYVFWFIIFLVILQFAIIRFNVAKHQAYWTILRNDQAYCQWNEYEKLCQDEGYKTISINETLKDICGFSLTGGKKYCN